MKLNKTYLIIASSSIALLVVLIIQVNWILQTARMKEELFNEKANMVLSKTAEALSSDTSMVNKMITCLGVNEVRKVDSLVKLYMRFYNVRIHYFFEVKPGTSPQNPPPAYGKNERTDYYTACVPDPASNTNLRSEAGNNGLELKLVFPDKEQFIIEEMGIPFITSVVLILVVLVMFWRTTVSLMKEKEISEHTTDFLNNMTHEFKTPLTNIALAGKMIVKESALKQEDKIKHYSGIILEENEKLRFQVEQVLSMTALERGEIPLQKTELDVHQLIRECVKNIGLQIENKQGHLKLDLAAGKFVVMGDRTHLANAFCNLVDNAIKYSAGPPELSIQTSGEDENLVITVSDRGIGIGEKYQKKVFDKFFRIPTGDVHNVKGFGLGLAYVKKIIELHGGTIALQSEIGNGTQFTITLPNV